MLNTLLRAVTASLVIGLAVASIQTQAKNEAPDQYKTFVEPVQIRCTCYIQTGTTASGKQTRKGVVAGKREWLGKTAILYAVNDDGTLGQFIGYYEFLDTGAGIDTDGDGQGDSIKNGTSIDVWQPTIEAVHEWQDMYGDYVYMQVIDAVG